MKRLFLISVLPAIAAFTGCDSAPGRTESIAVAAQVETKSTGSLPFVTDFDAALDQAKRDDKPLLIFFCTDWCSYCKQLESDVLARAEFRDTAKSFVCVKVDADRARETCDAYRVRIYPTLVLAAPDGTAIERLAGYLPTDAIVARMTAAVGAVVASRTDVAKPAIVR